MKAIVVTIETLQPVLTTSFQGDPNSHVSYNYIPGSTIRGAIIGRYKQQHQDNLVKSDLDLANSEVRRLFFEDKSTQYLNAYAVNENKQRTLPVPRSWFKDKNKELSKNNYATICDFSRIASESRDTCDGRYIDDDPFSPKSLEYDFCTVNGLVQVYSVQNRINIHNRRDRQKGRSLDNKRNPKNEGDIFRYNAIDTGQTFQAVILCQDEDVKTLTSLLELKDIWFGGSRSAGYGHCKIEHKVVDDWTEVGVPAEKRLDRKDLTITLLSDTILRDDWGQHIADPELIGEAIAQKLNQQLQDKYKPEVSYSKSTLIGGFNRKWGLPLPQVPAIAAGSIFVFEGIKVTKEQIQQLEREGIGERRIDGFGRIAVNWLNEEESFQVEVFNRASLSSSPISESSQELAETIAERIMRQRLEKRLLEEISIPNLESNYSKISNSQLSRLALVARQGLQQEPKSLDPVKRLLKTKNLTKNALDQFQGVKIREKSLYNLLKIWSDNPQSWISNSDELEVTIDNTTKQGITDQLTIEYTLRLIMAIAKKAIKEKKE